MGAYYLTNEKAIDNLKKEIQYSPSSIYAPIDSERYSINPEYKETYNPR